MKKNRTYLLTSLVALPFIVGLYFLLNPPQCPDDYTQAQVDASGCVVGASGGLFFFVVSAVLVWLIVYFVVSKISKK